MTLLSNDRSVGDGLLDDQGMAQRILDHIDHGTTDLGAQTWQEPVENYRSEARLAAEVSSVLRRFPTPFCPSAALPNIGSYVARVAAGTPIVVTRGHDRRVRGFRNACRHRGFALAQGSGCAKSLVCGYHGWTYHLDGRLRLVPDEYGFPGLDKDTHGLVPVPTVERHGVVFVAQDLADIPARDLDEVPELIAPDQQLIGSGEHEYEGNWKIFLESFLEGYHIRSTHRQTFYPFGFDNLNVVEHFGPHNRVTFPFRRIEKLRDVPPGERRVDGLLTYVYQLFPNVVIAVLSHHTTMAVLEPVGTDRTRMVSYTLTNRGRTGDEAVESATRDREFGAAGQAEDLAAIAAVQRGLSSGANQVVEFGLFEGAIIHFHRQLAAALEGGA